MRQWFATIAFALTLGLAATWATAGQQGGQKDNTPPPGFTALFNGKDLTGWQGLLMAPDTTDPKAKKAA